MSESGFNFQNTYSDLPKRFYYEDTPKAFPAPQVVIVNQALAQSLGIQLSEYSEKELAALFTGGLAPDGSVPFSQAYAGHQFGHFTMLGDGRAHMMGEHVTPEGERVDLQFKGSGPTPFSRRGDGLAALGPMLREYIISEAMHGLGIPTTRSLAVVTTGEDILRESYLPGAVLTRVASSHIRVGTFEFARATQEVENISALLDYTIERHFPELRESSTRELSFLKAVMERQVELVVNWMRVGFIHGVMNTDNMALSGESIDFGPCAFMDSYNPSQVFSSIDRGGRYAYGNQPQITQWNLARLAETLLPLIHEDEEKAVERAKETVYAFQGKYEEAWLEMMREKLGLVGRDDTDETLISDLLNWMHRNGRDFTQTFRELSSTEPPSGDHYSQEEFLKWHARYRKRRVENGQTIEASAVRMKKVNPAVIPRNHLVEEALENAEGGDLSYMNTLLETLKNPYAEEGKEEKLTSPPAPTNTGYQTYCGT